MAENVLVINVGSSSVKAAILMPRAGSQRPWSGRAERIGSRDAVLRFTGSSGAVIAPTPQAIPDHAAALELLLDAAFGEPMSGSLVAVGHRVVHGGSVFSEPALIDDEVVRQLQQLVPLAPLHMPQSLAAMAVARRMLPDLPQVACFDTTFHHSLPRLAQLIALPRRLTEAGVRRYGFHGLSYESVLSVLRRGGVDVSRERIVLAHLGAGASMCAVDCGHSVDTTMGFSTLSGLPMGSRCGDIDPGVLLYLLRERGLTPATLEQILYGESGLLAVSNGTADMQQLLARRNDPDAAEAVEFFCYQARRHLAALTASLGGIDRLVFTGGIGAKAPEVRERICEGLDYLGVVLDAKRNSSGETTISVTGSPVAIQAFDTDEEQAIAEHVWRLLGPLRP
jgi:acetate kinase